MTANVIKVLEKIKSCELFERYPLYFVGGTALAYYLEHRISEDIDIISHEVLPLILSWDEIKDETLLLLSKIMQEDNHV